MRVCAGGICCKDACQGDGRGEEIRAEVDRVRLDRRAFVSSRYFCKRARALHVAEDGDNEHGGRPDARLDKDGLEKEPLDHLSEDKGDGEEEQERLGEGGQVLRLAVAVRMVRVCRLSPHT